MKPLLSREWISTPESQALEGFGYSARRRILEVRFKHGQTYDYLGVPKRVFTQMKAAESRGRFVTEHIKPHYRFVER